jgi:hypothetical protein
MRFLEISPNDITARCNKDYFSDYFLFADFPDSSLASPISDSISISISRETGTDLEHVIFPEEWSHAKIRSECISFRKIVNARNSRAMTSSLSRLDCAPSIILPACLLSFDRGRRTLLSRMSETQVIIHTSRDKAV